MNTKFLSALLLGGLLALGSAATMASRDSDDYGGQGYQRGDSDDRGGYYGRGDDDDRGGYSRGDSDDRGYGDRRGGRGYDVAMVENQQYKDECGSCHFAYQPGLLPERSWRRLMDNLNDHFGENAELNDQDRQALTEYLAKNAGDHSNYRRSIRLMDSIGRNETPLRISNIAYFKREHRKIPRRVLDKISLSNCQSCHTRAELGSFGEGEIDIPGYGRWED